MNYCNKVKKGYAEDNPFHNPTHIVDTVQAMHYLYFKANFKRFLKKEDIFTSYIANLVHDFEHPGYTNQFIVRTKHPLAIRYNDTSVLESHHLASSFRILQEEGCNIMENFTPETFQTVRK